ncbi:hypothetical protein MRX96_031012 [Rhipicephalus microplus]
MADGVDIDLYADDLEQDFNQEGYNEHDSNVDLYDDVIAAPSSDGNADEVSGVGNQSQGNSHPSKRVALYIGNLTWMLQLFPDLLFSVSGGNAILTTDTWTAQAFNAPTLHAPDILLFVAGDAAVTVHRSLRCYFSRRLKLISRDASAIKPTSMAAAALRKLFRGERHRLSTGAIQNEPKKKKESAEGGSRLLRLCAGKASSERGQGKAARKSAAEGASLRAPGSPAAPRRWRRRLYSGLG